MLHVKRRKNFSLPKERLPTKPYLLHSQIEKVH